ncbi:hypothetical protein [Bradyrhizobium prioriisuperbiae]|uniref:hypothetical protein n=1 Tax=Bradyrhizobium prioriisuperbiae TaxID=2854389 RepID=UPI0028ED566B|nr:hypothetical protein [Bradyrhizobium prioritasuperba]
MSAFNFRALDFAVFDRADATGVLPAIRGAVFPAVFATLVSEVLVFAAEPLVFFAMMFV